MNQPHEVRLSHGARRSLSEHLPLPVAIAVWEFVIGPLAANPRRLGKPLAGQLAGHHAARRGSYRVVYTISDDPPMITIIRVDHRSAVYRR